MVVPTIFVAAVVVYTLVAAITDFRSKALPNWLTVPAFASAVVFHTATRGLPGLWFSLAGFGIGFGILFVLWLIGGGGAGDVKLMGALGAWLGHYVLWVFLFSTVFVAVGTIVVLSYQLLRHGGSAVKNRYATGLVDRKQKKNQKLTKEKYLYWATHRRVMGYGVPVALGTWVVLLANWVDWVAMMGRA